MIPGMMIVGQRGRPRGGGVAGYSPAFWYDADDLTTLFQDAAGTTPVTTDGDPVGLWKDKSGNNRNFSQSTSGNKPTWHTSAGYSWVEFDGSNDFLAGSTSMLAFTTINFFMGARIVSGGSDFGTLLAQPQAATHTNPFYRWSIQSRNTGGFTADFHINGTRTDMTDSGFAAGSDFIVGMGLCSMWDAGFATQRSVYVRLNKSVAHSGNSGATTVSYPNAVAPHMGSRVGGGGDQFKGRIYSIVGFDVAVTSTAWINDIENYIDTKVP